MAGLYATIKWSGTLQCQYVEAFVASWIDSNLR